MYGPWCIKICILAADFILAGAGCSSGIGDRVFSSDVEVAPSVRDDLPVFVAGIGRNAQISLVSNSIEIFWLGGMECRKIIDLR